MTFTLVHMTPTLALTAALLLSPVGVHSTTPDTSTSTDTIEVAQSCDAVGYRYYAHRVTAGTMHPDVWPGLERAGWVTTFAGPSSPVLVSPVCYVNGSTDS